MSNYDRQHGNAAAEKLFMFNAPMVFKLYSSAQYSSLKNSQ